MPKWLAPLAGATLVATAPAALAQTKIPVPDAAGVEMVLIPVPAGVDAASVLPGIIEKVGAANGGVAEHASPTQMETGGVQLRVEAASFQRVPGQSFFFLSIPAGRGVCMASMAKGELAATARAIGNACLAALGVNAGTSTPTAASPQAGESPRAAPARPALPLAAPAHAANWSQVEGVYFRNLAGFGAGGMAIMRFAPTIFFKDGTFYEIDDAALEDIDLAAARTAHPKRWGRWTRQGDIFTLTDEKGRAHDYPLQQGNLFKAFAADGATQPSGSYKNLSGGGNTAFGGDVMIATRSRFNFQPDGVYTTQRSTGASNSGNSTGVGSTVAASSAGEGRYRVEHHTITIEQPDGQRERRFFAFGSRKTPAQLDTGMLFIGDATYTRED